VLVLAKELLQPERQKELLLATNIHEQANWNWGPGIALTDFQGVATVENQGFIIELNFSGQKDLKFDLSIFRSLISLQVANFSECGKATGERRSQ
jgi:hypothetical protein